MDFRDYDTTVEVGMDEWKTLKGNGVIFTDGLGPCIGLCLAHGDWAGIIHSYHPPHDKRSIDKLIAAAKREIPVGDIVRVHPILCGSDPDCFNDGSGLDPYNLANS